jgi:hypothetical protein
MTNTAANVTFKPPTIGQDLIDECYKWSTANEMILNASKTKVLNVSLRKDLTMNANHTVNYNHSVDIVDETKLLGVHLDSHLNFGHHIESIRKAQNRKCHGLLVLKQAGVNQESLAQLYKAQILPKVTHTAAAWYPFTTTQHQDKLEQIQKLALRIIYPEHEHYDERLAAANFPTLRATLDSMCTTYVTKILNNSKHPLHNRIPRRPDGLRFSRRHDNVNVYVNKTRSVKCGRFILRNTKYLP